jgi:hypothetical protein
MRYFSETAPICVRGGELTCASYFCGVFEFLLFSLFWIFSFFLMLHPFSVLVAGRVIAFCMILTSVLTIPLPAKVQALMLFLVETSAMSAMLAVLAVPSFQSGQ